MEALAGVRRAAGVKGASELWSRGRRMLHASARACKRKTRKEILGKDLSIRSELVDPMLSARLERMRNPMKRRLDDEITSRLESAGRAQQIEFPDRLYYATLYQDVMLQAGGVQSLHHSSSVLNGQVLRHDRTGRIVRPYQIARSLHIAHELDVWWDSGRVRNLENYTNLLRGLGAVRRAADAVEAFRDMCARDIEPTVQTMFVLVNACAQSAYEPGLKYALEQMERFRGQLAPEQAQILRGMMVRFRLRNDDLEGALRLLSRTGSEPNQEIQLAAEHESIAALSSSVSLIEWTQLLQAFVRHARYSNAFKAWEVMRMRGIEPDVVAYTVMLRCCMATGDVKKASFLYETARRGRVQLGDTAYHYLARTFSLAGDHRAVKSLLQEARSMGFEPRRSNYLLLFKTLAHLGLADEMETAFEEIKDRFPQVPLRAIDYNEMLLGYSRAMEHAELAAQRDALVVKYYKTLGEMNGAGFETNYSTLASYTDVVAHTRGADSAFHILVRVAQGQFKDDNCSTLAFNLVPSAFVFSRVIRAYAKEDHSLGVQEVLLYMRKRLKLAWCANCFIFSLAQFVKHAECQAAVRVVELMRYDSPSHAQDVRQKSQKVLQVLFARLKRQVEHREVEKTWWRRFQVAIRDSFGAEVLSQMETDYKEFTHVYARGPRKGLPNAVKGINWWM
ncbi:putative pentatricopeptide repeat-containing protein [Porphyridium purpureum]|uniref:Putative pentatricopeptide repeat-containing protein n=1 Tax=Porphyridium purpureum TaxID=35688 RepID=A0A5J4YRM5_PORPP|nr:putative pentatricopeptide repeat-containing protein [Porphyridium purpureum]|eukprot:POR1586..scf229_5